MMGFSGKRRSMAALVACICLSLPITTAWAADSCLKTDNPCDPDKLCSFRSELAAKKLIYETYRANRNSNGPLYREAMAEAKGTGAAKLVSAGSILQDKVKAHVRATFRDPPCSSGMLDESLLPKKGYEGMHTDERCNVFAEYQKAPADAKSFGSSDATSCPEFYDRDRAHEVIHQQRCITASKPNYKGKDRFAIDQVAREEMIAYNHSVKLSRAYVRLLSLQCSAARTPEALQARAEKIQQWLAPYVGKLQ